MQPSLPAFPETFCVPHSRMLYPQGTLHYWTYTQKKKELAFGTEGLQVGAPVMDQEATATSSP